MNKDGDHAQPKAPRCQKQQNAQQHQSFQKKNHNLQPKDAHGGSKNMASGATGILATRRVSAKEKRTEKYNRLGKAELGTPECQKNQSAQRKLSDASNASEDLSKDSGCLSGKVSSSDSSSEISDCQSEENKRALDHQSSETDLSGSGTALDSSSGDRPSITYVADMRNEDNPSAKTWRDNALYTEGDGSSPGICGDPIASFPLLDLTGELSETTDDLVREVDDLRSENEYLKDEMEELRCEMLEMRDMFMEEEVYQLQELRVQLEQANKLCRILQYRLRKAERRSIRVAQTGQVDGELVRTLEHDIKVTKSVSVRLHSELESVQQKKSQLEWENEALRERLQDLEVAKQVLQTEMEKSRESSLKRRSVRSPMSKSEKKFSPQDDSADLICQLHFAKEESALMCKKLTKLALDSDHMREELARYRSVYGDIDASCSESASHSPYARESEVKVHLRLVEEEATLLSRRIVELELENRGLRAEMCDLRERGGGGAEEEEEPQDGAGERLVSPADARDGEEGEQGSRRGYMQFQGGGTTDDKQGVQIESQQRDNDESPAEGLLPQSQIARVGPIGGEQEPLDLSHKSDSTEESGKAIDGLGLEGHKVLLALRNHACLVGSAIQLLLPTPVQNGRCFSQNSYCLSQNGHCSSQNGHCSSPLSPYSPRSGRDLQGYLYGALELLHTMLLTFVSRTERLMMPGGETSFGGVKGGWDTDNIISLSEACDVNTDADVQDITESPEKQEKVEDLSETEVTEGMRQTMEEVGCPSEYKHLHGCGDPITRLTLQILWVLHQRCVGERSTGLEGEEVRETAIHALRDLLVELGCELQEKGLTDRETERTQSGKAESPVNTIVNGGRGLECKRTSLKETKHRKFKRGSDQKNRCYLSHEAVQLDQIYPFKTWDHPIMPFSFPGLDLDQRTLERSHTAPEKTALCIYYSPPSARRVRLAHLKQSSSVVRNSSSGIAPCHVSPSSVSSFCLRLSANLSDDMKEMTASIQQAVRQSSSLERRKGSVGQRWAVDVASSGTQTQTQQQPQMVDVGLQTDRLQVAGAAARAGSPRVPSSLTGRSRHHISSLERMPSRIDRPKSGSTSPKLYRRPSASTPSSPSTFTSSNSSNSYSFSSSSPAPSDRVVMSVSQSSPARLTGVRPTNARTASVVLKHSALSGDIGNSKPPSKPVAANRYGLVTEFLRRVSGRADKPAAGEGQKGKSALKNLERPPSTRPPAAASLHRNDSITRIVNQRFMKQRDDTGRVHKEEKGQSLGQVVKAPVSRDQSLSTIASEGGNYECSSKTLTFCFARPSRSTQRPAISQTKLRRQGYPAAWGGPGDVDCE